MLTGSFHISTRVLNFYLFFNSFVGHFTDSLIFEW
jgi:FANCM pseudonuclease domain